MPASRPIESLTRKGTGAIAVHTRAGAGRRRSRWWRGGDRWGLVVLLVAGAITLPLAAVLLHLGKEGEEWTHLVETVLGGYLRNTLVLVAGVVAASLLLGIFPAWLVSNYRFPGSSLFNWALVLPLAIPTYVAAFVFFQGPESAIPLLIWTRREFGTEVFVAVELVIRYGLLIVMMAAVLSPYVYLACRAAFTQQSRTVIEAARCLGNTPARLFFGVALPMARPAIVAGSALVVMEVINDYGAVHFFGVPTLTEGVFRTWFGMGDKVSALRLAGIVMLGVALLLVAEQVLRGRARYVEPEASGIPLARRQLPPLRGWLAALVCLAPLSVGFLYPVGRLAAWAWMHVRSEGGLGIQAGAALGRGLLLSVSTAIGATLLAALFMYAVRLRETRPRRFLGRAAGLGYATPGAVVALGVMAVFGAIDRSGWAGSVVLSGTLLAIGFAYMVRFFAIPLQFSRAGMERIGKPLEEASRVLGRPPLATFLRIDFPLLRGPLAAAAMLLFVDILKELPLTLILRPANFETLATTAFSLASEARLQACAVPALMIVATGAAGLLLMNRWLSSPVSHE